VPPGPTAPLSLPPCPGSTTIVVPCHARVGRSPVGSGLNTGSRRWETSIAGYAVATVAFIPGSVLTLASGALFGLVWGTVYAWTGATVGAGGAFLVARYAARGWVEKKLEGKPAFAHLDESIEKDGGKIVALLRLAPVFPFVLLNYALGLTKVRFWHYMVASLAMIPGTLLYVYYGHVGRAALEGGQTVWDWVLLGVGLVAVLVVTVVITKKAKRALAERTELEASEVGGE
jgi:uncharacterized membrane protein YdjX (TVP38/TMEM64 family)